MFAMQFGVCFRSGAAIAQTVMQPLALLGEMAAFKTLDHEKSSVKHRCAVNEVVVTQLDVVQLPVSR